MSRFLRGGLRQQTESFMKKDLWHAGLEECKWGGVLFETDLIHINPKVYIILSG